MKLPRDMDAAELIEALACLYDDLRHMTERVMVSL